MALQRWPRFVGTKESLIWFGVSVLLLVIGLIKSINLLTLVAYLSFAFLLVNGVLAWRMVRKVRAARKSPPPVFAGETAAILGEVENLSNGRAVMTLHEVRPGDARSWFLPALPGGVLLPFTAPLDFTTRGRHPLPEVQAVSSYPFGIMTWRRTIASGEFAVVLPALGNIDLAAFRRWLLRTLAVGDDSRRQRRRIAPAEGDVRGIRPYREGDSPRDVHWRSSARRGSLQVREYDQPAPVDLILIVDPWVPTIPTDPASVAKLEWALSLVVSIAWAWVHGENPGGLTLLMGGVEWTSRTGPGTPAFVRSGFAVLAEAAGSPAIPPMPPVLLRGASRSARLVISTRMRCPLPSQLAGLGASVAFVEPSKAPPWFTPRVEKAS